MSSTVEITRDWNWPSVSPPSSGRSGSRLFQEPPPPGQRVDMFQIQPFQHAEAAFADAGLGADAQVQLLGHGLGGIAGALQIAAVEGVEARLDGLVAHARGQLRGLLPAGLVQRNVLPALQAALAVPVGFAVADEPDFSHAGYVAVRDGDPGA